MRMQHLPALLDACVLGLIGGIIPGPVLTAVFTEILRTGLVRSLKIIAWAMFCEAAIALFILQILSSSLIPAAALHILSLVGAVILLWIAVGVWKITALDSGERAYFSNGKIAAMILSNGVLWMFWITVCAPRAVELSRSLAYGQYAFLGAFEIGWGSSTVLVALTFSMFSGLLRHPRIIPTLFKLFAVCFGYFAVTMIWTSARYFLHM